MLYLTAVVCAVLLISLLNCFAFADFSIAVFWEYLQMTLVGVLAVVLIDGVLAFLIRRMPESLFLPEARIFTVKKSEADFYRRTKINVWKKFVPEWGCFTGFHKDKLRSFNDSAYIGRFLIESNYGVAGHIAGAVFGFLIMLIPILPPLSVALPIAMVNLILNLLPTMILRANTPMLRRLYKRSLQNKNLNSNK